MIGIIGAMDIEVESLKARLENPTEEKISGVTFVTGRFSGKDVVVAKCGVGKVFAALCAEAMLMRFSPEMIINVGVAGCLDPQLKIGDIVIASTVVQHDMDTSPLGDPPGLLSDINVIHIDADKRVTSALEKSVASLGLSYAVGTIASGDQFVSSRDKKDYIISQFGASACEMEGAAIGHVCYVNGVPFGILRAMSDGADNGAKLDFPEFTRLAAANSTNVITEFLSII